MGVPVRVSYRILSWGGGGGNRMIVVCESTLMHGYVCACAY